MTLFDCTADLVGQLNGNGQKGMLQIDAPPVENATGSHRPTRRDATKLFCRVVSGRAVHCDVTPLHWLL